MNEPMNAQSFARLLKSRPDMLDDANAFAAVLREAYPGEKGSVNLMITAYNAGVVPMLRGGRPRDLLLAQIVLCLMDDYGVAEEKARWTAALWCDAYAAAAGGSPATETRTALQETSADCFEVEQNNSGCTIKKYIGPNEGDVVIPATIDGMPVTEIGIMAFYGCKGLTGVTIPDGVTTIEDEVFHFCENLTSVTIPGSVTKIGNGAFRGCESLTGITIPDSVTEIGPRAFAGCTALAGITIPNGVTAIWTSAFAECTSLTNVTIPDSVKKIWDFVFEACTSLTDITIPDSVTLLGRGVFRDCSPSLVIHGPIGSAAEKYAKQDNINFQAI